MLRILSVFLVINFSCGCKSLRGLSVDKFTDAFHHRIVIKHKELPKRKIDPEYLQILREFIQDARSRGVNIKPETIKKLRRIEKVNKFSVESGPGVIASCNRYTVSESVLDDFSMAALPIQYMTIEVLEKTLKRHASDGQGGIYKEKEKEVLYHELFHCLLNKGHLPPGEQGIMSAVIDRSSRRALEEWDLLVDELFSPKYLNLIPDT